MAKRYNKSFKPLPSATRTSLSAQALQELNVMANDILLAAAENEQLAGVLVKGDADLSSLSGGEAKQYWSYNYGLINGLDAAYGFYPRDS